MATAETKKIGRFETIKCIGRGSQGVVHLARDPNLQRYVVIKMLHPDNAGLGPDVEGTLLEGRISSRLNHPNIVSIFDADEVQGVPYLVFEYVQGQTLQQLLEREGAQCIEKACGLFGQILDGIAHAHAHEVIHLDISPKNILLDRYGVPRIMDFGLSKFAGNVPKREGTITGTIRYMSPEHFSESDLGSYTDVFALASTFFELITGTHAMCGERRTQIIYNIIGKSVDLSAVRRKAAGEQFARFLEGAFEKDYRARYFDGATMKEAFLVFMNEAEFENPVSGGAGDSHSTVEFLLRRMQRKKDFPSISRTLMDINRFTGDNSNADADKLANVILRDFALTSKLLKLVNSAFYGGLIGEVKSISRAVVLLGVEKIRMIANSLTLFSHVQRGSAGRELRESMTRSFLAGLMARHLAHRSKRPQAEEAFICGLFQNLGEILVIYYLPEDYVEIKKLTEARSLGRSPACRGVLGVSYEELGSAVARRWQLPDPIIDAISGVLDDEVRAPANEADTFRDVAVFANALCDLATVDGPATQDLALTDLLRRFEPSVPLSEEFARKLVAAGLEKLALFAPIFEINVQQSGFYRSLQTWLDWEREGDEEQKGGMGA